MPLLITLSLLLLSALPAFAQTVPTCEEQVTLLQDYVKELANQRSALENRLILTQASLKKSQEGPSTAMHPDVKARMEQIEAEKARVKKEKDQVTKGAP